MFNNTACKQTCGFGIDTEFSSTVDNIFLFQFQSIINQKRSLKFCRYMDDSLSFNNQSFK